MTAGDANSGAPNRGPDIWHLSGHGVALGTGRCEILVERGLAVVAEGSGSFSSGGLAAQVVVDLLPVLCARAATAPRVVGLANLSVEQLEGVASTLAERVEAISAVDPFYSGMAAEFAALIMRQGTVLVAHIGACRVYRIRQGELALLTRDHVHPHDPRFVMRALGASASDIEVEIHAVEHGDRFLLSSMTTLRDEDILEALSDDVAELAARRLLDVAPDIPRYAFAIVDAHAAPSLNALTRSAAWSGVVRSG